MTILAWIILVILAINVPSVAYFAGKHMPRANYGISDVICSLINTAITLPLIGRILGWW